MIAKELASRVRLKIADRMGWAKNLNQDDLKVVYKAVTLYEQFCNQNKIDEVLKILLKEDNEKVQEK